MFNDKDVRDYAEEHNVSYVKAYRILERKSVGLPVEEYGGEGSGNFGHGGRPGEVGGSSSSDEILEGGEVIDDKKGIGVVKRVSPDKLVTVKWEDGSSTVRSISELQGYGGRPGVK